MEERNHLLSLLVYNRPGALSRISGIFGRLGCNIKSLCVAETTDPDISRITMVSRADSRFTEKITKNLDKLVDVIEVEELSQANSVERELTLVGIAMEGDTLKEITRAVDLFKCDIVSMNSKYCVLGIVAGKEHTDTALSYLSNVGISDIARTGIIALKNNNDT